MIKNRLILVIFIFLLPLASHAEDLYRYAESILVKIKFGNEFSTGFFWMNDTTIITSYHSVPKPGESVSLFLPSDPRKEIKGSVVMRSEDFHLAIVAVNSKEYKSSKFIKPDQIYEASYERADLFAFYDQAIKIQPYQTKYPFQSLRTFFGDELGYLCDTLQNKRVSCDMIILPMSGVSIKGYSGAPILFVENNKIKILGINIGGIAKRNEAWVIPAVRLWNLYLKYHATAKIKFQTERTLYLTKGNNSMPFGNTLAAGKNILDKTEFSFNRSNGTGHLMILPKGMKPYENAKDYFGAGFGNISLFYFNTETKEQNHNLLDLLIKDAVLTGYLGHEIRSRWKADANRIITDQIEGFKRETYFYEWSTGKSTEKKCVILYTKSTKTRLIVFALKCVGENTKQGMLMRYNDNYYKALASLLYSVYHHKD